MDFIVLLGLFLFLLEAASKLSLVILAVVALKCYSRYFPSKPVFLPRLWGASKAVYKELFHPNGSASR